MSKASVPGGYRTGWAPTGHRAHPRPRVLLLVLLLLLLLIIIIIMTIKISIVKLALLV